MTNNKWPPIMCANWKMNMTSSEGANFAKNLVPLSQKITSTMVWIAPPFTSINAVQQALQQTPFKVGAQNIHWEESGAYTGEISWPMLAEEGVEFVIVGHSERRHIFGESSQMIANRAKVALSNNLYAIVCVGETEIERNEGATEDIIADQLSYIFDGLTPTQQQRLVIAYEPVWAIGTGKVATEQQIGDVHKFIHQVIARTASGLYVPVLYGGSVNPDNFESIIQIPDVSGALVGGASLDLVKFKQLIEIAEKKR